MTSKHDIVGTLGNASRVSAGKNKLDSDEGVPLGASAPMTSAAPANRVKHHRLAYVLLVGIIFAVGGFLLRDQIGRASCRERVCLAV